MDKKAFLIIFGFVSTLATLEYNGTEKAGKILNFFTVVRFPNNACTGTNNLNGTCYSAEECESKTGSSAGACAGGYGVCCIFQLSCGQTTSGNCSYFQSNGQEVGQCRLMVCPCSNDICQLRLDFQSFVINLPVTATLKLTFI